MGSGHKCQPAFCRLWFQCQFHLQSSQRSSEPSCVCAPWWPGGDVSGGPSPCVFPSQIFGVKLRHVPFEWAQEFISHFIRSLPQTPSSLPCPQYLLVPGLPFSVLQPEGNQKRERKILSFSLKILFPVPWARTRGFLQEPISSFRLPSVQTGQHWSWQSGKLTLGLEVLWSLVFLLNPSATIYRVTLLLHEFCSGYSCIQGEREVEYDFHLPWNLGLSFESHSLFG